ncbi:MULTISPECIES: NADPH-dependent FMN reductase [unclassified Sphingobium]|uniref:NADPH-dependent FMN reductase n=1 Tax=unclassified Sphingobium TaxID=2611147 RepID=UPI0022246138|nr:MULTISPECIES: NAD(P)H-dependent oxidoreductase [unclassified Sphingobium]MCW2383065.1 chromate reductase [Sphingobium sp. B2D3B]MCW2399959.1 chromate reductase [Sphingobium sp. B2D3C]
MSGKIDVAVIVGSLRKDSYNRKAALELARLADGDMALRIVEIGDLPHYDEDAETDSPPGVWTRFRKEIAPADALLFVTPEYNRSVPGVLKNAIDVGSRPYGQSVWMGKPAAIMTVSPGALGGFGANHHLRQMLVFQDTPILQQPEAYVGNAAKLFEDDGRLTDKKTEDFFRSFLDAFRKLIDRAG